MDQPIPVILCGKTAEIAKAVVNGLQPEIEVVHVILTVPSFTSIIPPLLSGNPPVSPSEDQIGTQNYTRRPVAIVTGAGYDDAMIETMQEECKKGGVEDVPFLRPDLNVATPPLGPKYGAAMVARVKACISELAEEGRLGGGGVWYF